MRKLLTLIAIIASFLLVSCSSDPVVNRLPWVYKIEIQQGNVLNQDSVNQLRTGMTRRQVQFVLGNPMIVDPFHANRWEYYYQYQPGTKGTGEPRQDRLALFFEEERLVRWEGSMLPNPDAVPEQPDRQVTIDVPPQQVDDPGILTRFWRWLTFSAPEPELQQEKQTFQPETGTTGDPGISP